MTATPSAPAAMTAAALPASIPAIPTIGRSRARRRKTSGDLGNTLRAYWRHFCCFRDRGVDAPDAGIINKIDRSSFGLGNSFDRQPDNCLRSEQPARICGRHIVGPDMHSVGSGGERHVNAVVDDKSDVKRRQSGLDRRAVSTMARVSLFLSRNCTRVAPPAAPRGPDRADRVRRSARDR